MVLAPKKNCQRVLAASLRVVSAMTGNPPLGSYKLKDPIREAKLVGLLCNSFVLNRIKSISGMQVL